jgi:hypothetical protein
MTRWVDGAASLSSSVIGLLIMEGTHSWPADIGASVALMVAYLALVEPRVRSWEAKRRRECDEAPDGRLTTHH